MAWPTSAELTSMYTSRLTGQPSGRVAQALVRAVADVKDAFAAIYDVSGWDESTPPAVSNLVFPLACAYVTAGVHVGADMSSGDQAADSDLKDARAAVLTLARGGGAIRGPDGSILPKLPFSQRGSV